jgi:hypothetical protein
MRSPGALLHPCKSALNEGFVDLRILPPAGLITTEMDPNRPQRPGAASGHSPETDPYEK